VTGRPVLAGAVIAHVVAQQQLPQPVPRAHQVTAEILARPHQITQRLLRAARDPDRMQPPDHQQPQHALGVTLVGLDPVLGGTLDLARRRHHATDPRGIQRTRQPVARRPGLIGHARRARQRRAEPHHLARRARQPPRAHLTRQRIDGHGEHTARVHIQTGPAANLCHGRLLLCGCGRRAGCHPHGFRTPHDRVGDRPCLPAKPDSNLHMVYKPEVRPHPAPPPDPTPYKPEGRRRPARDGGFNRRARRPRPPRSSPRRGGCRPGR
jgi:hypothetical protein